MMDVRRVMDQLRDYSGLESSTQQFSIAMNVSETSDAYLIEASLPGVDPDDVEITFFPQFWGIFIGI